MRRAIQVQEQHIQVAAQALDRLRVDILRRDEQSAVLRRQLLDLGNLNSRLAADLQSLRDSQMAVIQPQNSELRILDSQPADDFTFKRDSQLAVLQLQVSELSNLNAQLETQLQSLLTSTSWRVMAPMRSIFGRSPRLSRTSRRLVKLVWWTVTLQLPARVREIRSRNRQLGPSSK